jgi:hypothetical protein
MFGEIRAIRVPLSIASFLAAAMLSITAAVRYPGTIL